MYKRQKLTGWRIDIRSDVVPAEAPAAVPAGAVTPDAATPDAATPVAVAVPAVPAEAPAAEPEPKEQAMLSTKPTGEVAS